MAKRPRPWFVSGMSQPPAPDFTRLGDARIFIDRMAYADLAAWHAAAARLRADDPLPLVDVAGYVPFRAVTRHADVAEVERNHTLFWNTRDSVLLPRAQVEQAASSASTSRRSSTWTAPSTARRAR